MREGGACCGLACGERLGVRLCACMRLMFSFACTCGLGARASETFSVPSPKPTIRDDPLGFVNRILSNLLRRHFDEGSALLLRGLPLRRVRRRESIPSRHDRQQARLTVLDLRRHLLVPGGLVLAAAVDNEQQHEAHGLIIEENENAHPSKTMR